MEKSLRIKRALALKYLRFSQFALKEIEKVLKENLVNKRIVDLAIHIRKGDKLAEEARPISLNVYLNNADKILSKMKADKPFVFIASDDREVAPRIRLLRKSWIVLTIPPKDLMTSGHSQHQFNMLSKEEQAREGIHVLADLYMMINAREFLGTFSSNIGRLVQIMRKRTIESAHSLDEKWYPN